MLRKTYLNYYYYFTSFKIAPLNGGKVRICHVENKELADNLITSLKSEYPDADTLVYPARGLCSYYCERGGIIIGIEG